MSGPLSAIRVLLADDNPHMRSIVAGLLEGLGVQHILQCADGASALDSVRSFKPDLAIVDFQMAPVDGVEFTRLVRNAEGSANPYLPIIMLTGYADRTRVFEARDAGVTELIVKPVTPQAVIGRLNAVIYPPRPFIRCEDYFGPCRRRTANPSYKGPERRKAAEEMKISA